VKEHQGGAALPERPCTQTSGQQLRDSDDLFIWRSYTVRSLAVPRGTDS
jgi:hypothetical protein